MKRTKLNKYSKREIPKLKRKLWVIFSRFIRLRDKNVCFTCGQRAFGVYYHCGHFITRNNQSTLFDEVNNNGQCASCNIWLRGNVGVYAKNLITKYGKAEFDSLVARGRETKQWTAGELVKLIDKYKRKVKDLESKL